MGIDSLIFGGIWYSVVLRRWRDHEKLRRFRRLVAVIIGRRQGVLRSMAALVMWDV